MPRLTLIWGGLAGALLVPIALAAGSPLLAWRQPIYIIGGFGGIVAFACLLLQPLLAGRYLPLSPFKSRALHRWVGTGLVVAIVVHVVGLWITSPPDMIDALTFTSPTPFSAWGVIAMWAAFAAAALAALRQRLAWRPARWRFAHGACAVLIVTGSVIHALQIEGAMEPVSKALFSAMIVAATAKLIYDLARR